MGVFNNLVVFDQQVKQNSLDSIVPDLATAWSWNEDGTELTFPLRQGVTWHDGKPFMAKDVQCTFGEPGSRSLPPDAPDRCGNWPSATASLVAMSGASSTS